jgi:hypothetical protein
VIKSLSSNQISLTEIGVSNSAVVLLTYDLENLWVVTHENRKTIHDSRINLIKTEKYNEMKADLKKRTGISINRLEVGKIDFLTDASQVRIFYFTDSEQFSDYSAQ